METKDSIEVAANATNNAHAVSPPFKARASSSSSLHNEEEEEEDDNDDDDDNTITTTATTVIVSADKNNNNNRLRLEEEEGQEEQHHGHHKRRNSNSNSNLINSSSNKEKDTDTLLVKSSSMHLMMMTMGDEETGKENNRGEDQIMAICSPLSTPDVITSSLAITKKLKRSVSWPDWADQTGVKTLVEVHPVQKYLTSRGRRRKHGEGDTFCERNEEMIAKVTVIGLVIFIVSFVVIGIYLLFGLL